MIRPITILCAIAFAGSGFYLYQSKHHSQVVDRDIVKTMKAVDAAHNRALLLRAEYALLNDPERLQQFADQYLTLRPTAPTQFVAMADLQRRLPPVGVAPIAPPPVEPDAPAATLPTPAAPADIPIANAAPPAPTPAPTPAPAKPVAVATAPQAPAHSEPARPSVLAAARPLEAPVQSVALVRPLPRRTEPVQGEPLRPIVLHPPSQVYRAPQRPYTPPSYGDTPYQPPRYAPAAIAYRAPAPTPYQAPYQAASRPMVGSALGMARSMPGYPTVNSGPGGDGH